MGIILVTGKVNSGKTTLMEKMVEQESLRGKFPAGIIAHGVFKESEKIGFNITDLSIGKSIPLARVGNDSTYGFSVGRFVFLNESLNFAKNALLNFRLNGVVFLDEVGPLELKGKGYAECLDKLLGSDINRLYISVREECLARVRQMFLLPRPTRIIETEKLCCDMLNKTALTNRFQKYM